MQKFNPAKRPPEIELIRQAIRNPGAGAPPVAPIVNDAPHETITIRIKGDGEEEEDDFDFADTSPEDDYPDETSPFFAMAQGDKLMYIKPANQWIAEQRLKPAPKKLFGGFWCEGELCLLFADTNMGKSILAVQLGDSISRGVPIGPFEMEAEAGSPALYIDFELSAKQFELRYSSPDGRHLFSPEFYRAEYNTQMETPDNFGSFDAFMRHNLAWAIRNTTPAVLIIDNITCLSEGGTQSAGRAVALMKHLKALQVKHRLSILVLAHTPKRNPATPITRDDIGGSKMLMNLADSAFAIGQSYAPGNRRYLKQVKQRSGAETHGQNQVCLFELERADGFLKYRFTGTAHESDHLLRRDKQDRAHTAAQVADLHKTGLSQRQIAARLQIGLATVNRMVGWAKDGQQG